MSTPRMLYCAGIIVYTFDREVPLFLLLHHLPAQGNHWDFPKGKREKGETLEATAARELFEEAHISASIISGFHEISRYQWTMNGVTFTKQVDFFVGQYTGQLDAVKLSHEHQNYAWLAFDQARARITFEKSKELLEQAYSFIIGSQKKRERF